jgi:cytochrome c5
MKMRSSIAGLLLALLFFSLGLALTASANNGDKSKDIPGTTTSASHSAQDDPMRAEGEKRFRANCSRCHAAPPKFAPRMMATIVRHMRVRASLTEQDQHYILHYMTQ